MAANGFKRGGEQLNLGAGLCQRRLKSLRALQAGQLLVLKAVGLRGAELDFVFDGLSLGRSGDRVGLRAQTTDFFAMGVDLALKAGTKGLLASESGGGIGRLALHGGEIGMGLGHFSRQGACFLGQACALQLEGLKFYQIFDERLHPCNESKA